MTFPNCLENMQQIFTLEPYATHFIERVSYSAYSKSKNSRHKGDPQEKLHSFPHSGTRLWICLYCCWRKRQRNHLTCGIPQLMKNQIQ